MAAHLFPWCSEVASHCPSPSCAFSPAIAVTKLSDSGLLNALVPLVTNGERMWALGSSLLAGGQQWTWISAESLFEVGEGLKPPGCFSKHCLDGWIRIPQKWCSCVLGPLSLLDGSLCVAGRGSIAPSRWTWHHILWSQNWRRRLPESFLVQNWVSYGLLHMYK